MDGLIISPLKQIHHPKGDVLHGMKASDQGYAGFGEAYFSSVNMGQVKGWKKHTKMTMNIVVPVGAVKLVFYDMRETSPSFEQFQTVTLSKNNYKRVTIPPNIWVAFQGQEDVNLLLNLASIEHSPEEAESIDLEHINYDW
jgi:dTDP-4-dehydrorhamnose 3,5-epimerase